MTDYTERLQVVLEKQIDRGGVGSIVAALESQDRRIQFCGAAGTADSRTGTAMTPDTPYFIASITKMFTAAVILRLSEQAKLDLKDPVSAYLPRDLFQGIHVFRGEDYSEQITIKQLVSQTSGLADFEADKPRGGRSVMAELKAGQDRYIDLEEALRIVRGLSPHFPPGASGKAYYSNTNYRLLGAIIERVTGKPMADNFQEEICVPLGLENTYLYDWTQPRSRQPAEVYLKGEPVQIPKYLSSNISDGGLVSTAPECLRFIRAFFEGELFGQEQLDRMMDWNPVFFPLRYGWGLMLFKLPRYFWFRSLPEFIGHSGSTGSFAFLCPSRSLYMVGSINQVSPAKPFILMMDLVRAIG